MRRTTPSTCHCDVCKSLVHGTQTAYEYYKCRCDVCRAGNTERNKETKVITQRLRDAGMAVWMPKRRKGDDG